MVIVTHSYDGKGLQLDTAQAKPDWAGVHESSLLGVISGCLDYCVRMVISLHSGQAAYDSCSMTECADDLGEVQVSDTLELDVRLHFINGGNSGCTQEVTLLRLIDVSTEVPVYVCDFDEVTDETCPPQTGRQELPDVRVTQGPDVYDIQLELEAGESGVYNYKAEYSLIDPRNGGTMMITKLFTFTVTGNINVCTQCMYMYIEAIQPQLYFGGTLALHVPRLIESI